MKPSIPDGTSAVRHDLSRARRRPVSLQGDELVSAGPGSEADLPVVLQAQPAVDALAWLRDAREQIRDRLAAAGALLFRGFNVHTAEMFRDFASACGTEVVEYRERSSPRTEVSDRVYTSTDHPADQRIFPHNEHSYAARFPLKLLFCCAEPARTGGETPVADIRKVGARIPRQIQERFAEKRWMLVRNYGTGFGVPWTTAFQTDDKAQVERWCRERRIDCEWRPNGRLRTRQVRPPFARHPLTGERLWFNHATFFHVSTLDEATREGLLAAFAEEDLPANTYYGDGTPIEPETLIALRAAYEQELVTFSWQRGDVLLLDNMRVAHSRNPYEGPRRVLCIMADPYERADA